MTMLFIFFLFPYDGEGFDMEDLQGVILTKTRATYADILAGSDLGVCPTRSFAPKNCKFARHKRS